MSVKTIDTEIRVCDICGREGGKPYFVDLVKCDYCGKELCPFCRATVYFRTVDLVRGWEVVFGYEKTMCQSHLPKEK